MYVIEEVEGTKCKLKTTETRKKENDRCGFKLSSEMDNLANIGGPAIVRAGQFWEVDGGLLEISSVLESKYPVRK